ncbi:MAG: decaprenyl-phosphate phosphoribosyltransferase [Thermodesulfobacteriota bacterium]
MPISIKDILYISRPNQWIKNLLVIAPPFFGGVLFFDFNIMFKMIIAFLAFSFTSSSGYIINDIIDKSSDSQHPLKKLRPIASGRFGQTSAIIVILVLLIISIFLSLQLNTNFLYLLAVYFFINISYSVYLQNILIVDVFIIAIGFVMRIEAGGVASDIQVSSWLLLTTFLLSLLLAFGKRRFELSLSEGNNISFRKVLKDYNLDFLDSTLSIFATIAIVTYSIYAVEKGPRIFLITVPFACYGVLRYLYLVKTNKSGDPTDSLLKDKSLFFCVFIWLLITGFVIYM